MLVTTGEGAKSHTYHNRCGWFYQTCWQSKEEANLLFARLHFCFDENYRGVSKTSFHYFRQTMLLETSTYDIVMCYTFSHKVFCLHLTHGELGKVGGDARGLNTFIFGRFCR